MKFACYAHISASKYLGIVEAASKEEAEEKAWNLPQASVYLCHQCSRQAQDAEIDSIEVEETND